MVAGDFSPGQQVALELRLPNVALPVRAKAKVRYQGPARCGFEFVDLAIEQREMIRYWMYKLTAEPASQMTKSGTTKTDTTKTDTTKIERTTADTAKAEIIQAKTGAASSAKTQSTTDSQAQSSAESARVDKIAVSAAGRQEMRATPEDVRKISAEPRKPARDPRKSSARRIVGWTLSLLLCSTALAAVGWWQWQRSWRELERETIAQTAPVRLPAETMAQRIVSKVEPVYPEDARRAGIQGLVVFDALIAMDGTVARLSPVSGNEMLSKSAAEVVRQWKFEPYRLSGRAREVETTISVEFHLD